MLEHLRGSVDRITSDAAVLSIGGVGLRVKMSTADLATLDGEVTVHTVMQIRDDEVHLYGFSTERGRELFRALQTVSSVGPKVALAILSYHPPQALERTLAAGDVDAMTLVPGVGRKTAQRIVLELRDKLGVPHPDEAATGSVLTEVKEALKGLGYTSSEVQDALGDLPPDGDAPTLLRHALRALGGAEPVSADR